MKTNSTLTKFTLIAIVSIALSVNSYSQSTIVNYDFNNCTHYSNLNPTTLASNITCASIDTSVVTFTTYTGTASGSQAFINNNTAGYALAMSSSDGNNTKYWTFQLGGSALSNYKSYKLYMQAQRSGTGATTITLQYSTDGSTYTSFGTTMSPGNGSFSQQVFDLSSITSLDNHSNIYIRIMASGASGTGTLRIDNLEILATEVITVAGPTGPTGPIGPTGIQGTTGAQGPTGATGPTGADGAQNAWGLTGNTGTSITNNFIGTTDNNGFKIKTYNIDRLTISNAGYVGIGSGNPVNERKLYIFDESNPTMDGHPSGLRIEQHIVPANIWSHWDMVVGNGSLFFNNSDQTGDNVLSSSALTINSNGNVGIGTGINIPSQKLEISHDDPAGGINLNRVNTSADSKSEIKFSKNSVEKWAIGYDLSNNGSNTFFVWDHTAGTSRLFIDGNGLIGIGTESPNFKLDIDAGTSGGLEVKTTHTSDWGYCIQAKVNYDHTKAFAVWEGTAENFIVYGNGTVWAHDIHVKVGTLGDFVFDKNYNLLSINQLENFINQNQHLPGIPSATEVNENGLNVGEFQNLLLQKIEEQSLYIINLQKQIDELKALINASINK